MRVSLTGRTSRGSFIGRIPHIVAVPFPFRICIHTSHFRWKDSRADCIDSNFHTICQILASDIRCDGWVVGRLTRIEEGFGIGGEGDRNLRVKSAGKELGTVDCSGLAGISIFAVVN
jgi:hypothetical protein